MKIKIGKDAKKTLDGFFNNIYKINKLWQIKVYFQD